MSTIEILHMQDQLTALASQASRLKESDLEPLNSVLRARGVVGTATSPVKWINLIWQLLPLIVQFATGGITPALIQSVIQVISQWFLASTQQSSPSP